MTRKRALELIRVSNNSGNMFPEPGLSPITEAEHAEVMAVWRKMPGYTCFVDALYRIAEDNK